MNDISIRTWKIHFIRQNGKGIVCNSMKYAEFFVGYNFELYLYNKNGSQFPLPKIPAYIKKAIIANEKLYRKLERLTLRR